MSGVAHIWKGMDINEWGDAYLWMGTDTKGCWDRAFSEKGNKDWTKMNRARRTEQGIK